jgi:hypothetical protein
MAHCALVILGGALARCVTRGQGGPVGVVTMEAVAGGATHVQRELDGVAAVDAWEGLVG